MVKEYLELNEKEKFQLYEFVNRNNSIKKSICEVNDMFNNKINGYGKGSLLYFENGKVVGKINIVLEVCKSLKTIYINSIEILEDFKNKELVVEELINNAVNISKKHNPLKILLGERNEEIMKILENLGFKKKYSALNMFLEDRNIKEEILDLVKLTKENKQKYLKIFNDSFSDMPHGTFCDLIDIEGYINKSNDKNYFFMVAKDNNIIGFMNCEIKEERGIFDIGLCKNYRGKGYGKKLLETAIDFLNKKEVENIELIVIEKNTIAYNMYKNRGFKKKSVLSYWMEIKYIELVY